MLTEDLPRIFAPSLQAHLLKARCQGAKLARYPWLNALCRTMGKPLVVFNKDRRVVKANRALLKMFGLADDAGLLGGSLDIKDTQVYGLREEHLQVDGDDFWLVTILDRRTEERRLALEASPDGAVVTVDYGRRDRRSPGGQGSEAVVRFSVHNPGHIPAEAQPFIFTRAFSTKGAGRGLGTYAMKLLCERFLGGRVDFRSHPAAGTVFTVTLPFDGPCRSG